MTEPASPERGASLRWALRRRCPSCGARIFATWLRTLPRCSACGLLTDRGEHDYFLGAMLLNLIAAESVPVLVVGGTVLATWPDPPWTLLRWGGIGLAVIIPFIGYPFAKTLWLFLDMQFRAPVRAPESGGGAGPGIASER